MQEYFHFWQNISPNQGYTASPVKFILACHVYEVHQTDMKPYVNCSAVSELEEKHFSRCDDFHMHIYVLLNSSLKLHKMILAITD